VRGCDCGPWAGLVVAGRAARRVRGWCWEGGCRGAAVAINGDRRRSGEGGGPAMGYGVATMLPRPRAVGGRRVGLEGRWRRRRRRQGGDGPRSDRCQTRGGAPAWLRARDTLSQSNSKRVPKNSTVKFVFGATSKDMRVNFSLLQQSPKSEYTSIFY
jgi:hypothetical protein